MKVDDRVIGLMSGKTAKAYPGGILAQHGFGAGRFAEGTDRHHLVKLLQHSPRVQG